MKKYIFLILLLSNSFAYSQVDPDCCFDLVEPLTNFGIQEDPLFANAPNIHYMGKPIIGDLDSNGINEIISFRPRANASGNVTWTSVGTQRYFGEEILLTSANNPNNVKSIPFDSQWGSFNSVAIGDILPSIPGIEMVAVNLNQQVILFSGFSNINNNLTVGYTSVIIGQLNNPIVTPNIADFNQDGQPEIYIGNKIFYFDGVSWNKTTTTTTFNGSKEFQLMGGGANSARTKYNLPLAIDVMPNPGLEFVLGPKIYSFSSITGALTLLYDANNQLTNSGGLDISTFEDGYISAGNLDGDANIEILVNGSIIENSTGQRVFGIYVYDPITNQCDGFIKNNAINAGGFGHFSGAGVTIAEIDNTFQGAEIIYLNTHRLGAHNITSGNPNHSVWTTMGGGQSTLPIFDGSGMTGITSFDFNNDGIKELIYRDEQNLRVMYGGPPPFPTGVDAQRNWFITPLLSGTGTEYPSIVDIDNDGEAEIIVYGNYDDGTNTRNTIPGSLVVYERLTGSTPTWSSTRNSWNQSQYFHQNVNSNLTIPTFQPSQMAGVNEEYNLFLGQPSFKANDTIWKPDVRIRVLETSCSQITVELCNDCNEDVPSGMPVTMYDLNPTSTSASIVQQVNTSQIIAKNGGCVTMVITTNNVPGNYYIVANDDGSTSRPFNLLTDFPNTNIDECAYEDNIAGAQVSCPPTPFPECCENPLTIERTNEGNLVNAPSGIYNSDPFSLVQDEFTIQSNSLIPITEFRAVVTDIDFNYNYESCATCIDNPALWGSIGGSLYVGNKLTNLDTGTNILSNRINRREVIWKENNGAMLSSGDKFTLDYAFPALSEIPCCVTTAEVCVEISYKDANCLVCTENICRTIDLTIVPPPVTALAIKVNKEGCCNRTLTANADTNAGFVWSTGETSQTITVAKNGTYTVTATSGGTTKTETIVVNDIMSGSFPLLSFNSLFHPDFVPPYKNKFYIMDVSAGKVIEGVPNSYNATEYKLEIYHRWNTQGGQGQPLKTIMGISDSCNGFNNWDIQWDGTDQNGNSLKDERGDSYVWHLTLKNCDNESSKLTYKTNWVPICEEPRYLFPKRKWIRIGCKKWGGYWNTETFSFGDVQMHR